MNAETYRFKLGAFECIVISDGTRVYPGPGQAFFYNAPQEELANELRQHGIDLATWDEKVMQYLAMVIYTGDHVVLVDTGAGNLETTTGNLMANLRAEKVDPHDIDTVIIGHGHPDHIGGNTDEQGKTAFPNARYVMWKDDWDYWTTTDLSDIELDAHIKEILLSSAKKYLPPIKDQLELIDQEQEIVPGISAVASAGHTPGHIALALSSEGNALLYIGDAVFHPIHFSRPDWHAAFDISPQDALASRRRLLDRAATENALVFGSHLSFPGLGRVTGLEQGWSWQPI